MPRFPKNAPGVFYTTGWCAACGAPEDAAPDLLAPLTDDNYDTYFVRQPETAAEVESACHAAEVCCLSALRYAGNDAAVIRRLGNRASYCDHPLPGGPIRMSWETDAGWEQVQAAWRARRRWWQFWRAPGE